MKTKEDLVSIIMPAYNCGNFIGLALESVINQTYQNWEVIIVDDCSTDNTAEVVQDFMRKDSRIKYYKLDQNSGAAMARNKAIEIAKGKYLAFLDSDDIWFPEKLMKQISFMEKNNYGFTCTSYTKIDENGKYLNRTIIAKPKLDYNGILKSCPGNSTVKSSWKLSEDFDFICVDLYILDDVIYFGEMTNTPGNGFESFYPRSFDFELGKKITFSKEHTIN